MSRAALEAMTGVFLRHSLERVGSAPLRISGHSMSPILPDGAKVLLRPLKEPEALRGAFVAIDWGSRVVVHQVDSEKCGLFRTRGLRARYFDKPATREQIIGVVCKRCGRLPMSERALRAGGSLVGGALMTARRVLDP